MENYEIQKFTETEHCSWLEDKEDITEDIITVIETNHVNGKTFVDLSDDDLKELFSLFGDRKAVQRIVASLKPQPQSQPHHVSHTQQARSIMLNVFSIDSKQDFMHLCISNFYRLFSVHYNQLGVARTHWAISRFQIDFLELLWSAWTKGRSLTV